MSGKDKPKLLNQTKGDHSKQTNKGEWSSKSHIEKQSHNDMNDPPGFSVSVLSVVQKSEDGMEALKQKKAWELAISPSKSIPMNAIMLYMSGSSVQIFSIMITVMLLFNSIKAILTTLQTFERFTNGPLFKDPMVAPMLVFVAMNLLNLALGVWKCSAMGLLPTTSSDWLAIVQPRLWQHVVVGN